MSYHGDITLGDTIDVKFSTRDTSGVPTTLAGTPVISAYVGNGTTQITAGITLTVDFDGVTGLHNCRVVASAGNGFTTTTNVSLIITAGTVDGTSVVGEQIASFSIDNRDSAGLDAAGVRAAVGLAAADLDTQLTALPTAAEAATAVLTTAMAESYNADGAAPTLTQAVLLALQILSESSVSGTTLTVKRLDGSTTAATYTLSDATAPTSITRAS